MSLYQGWNREAMVEAGCADREAMEQLSGPSLSCFTPINPSHVPVQLIDSLKTVRESGHEGNGLFVYRPEAAAEIPGQNEKKRSETQAKKGRAISIGRVWECMDEGDVAAQNQGPDFESSFPKRRKSAPARRTKYTPEQSKNLTKPDNASPASVPGYHEGEERSQVTTLTDSSRQATKKAAPKPRKAQSKAGPFQNSVITKPSVARETIYSGNTAGVKPVTIHQGWTSTEEAMKHKFNGISKTTLDKLAAFRYKSSAESQAEVASSVSRTIQEAHQRVEKAEGVPLSSDYDCLPSDEPGSKAGYAQDHERSTEPARCQVAQSQGPVWITDDFRGEDAFFNDAIWNVDARSDVDENAISSQNQLFSMGLHQNASATDPVPTSPSAITASQTIAHPALSVGQGLSPDTSEYGELSSSELKKLREMPSHIDISEHVHLMPAIMHMPARIQDKATDEYGLDSSKKPGGLVSAFEDLPDPSIQNEKTGKDPIFRHTRIVPKVALSRYSHSTQNVDVHVERSDIDNHEMTSRASSKDCNLDDFDNEGVDDATLLAIASQTALPETQFIATGTAHMTSGRVPVNGSPTVESPEYQHAISMAGDEQYMREFTPMSSVELSEDEFPLEDGLEEEDMIYLPAHMQGVIETFEAPPSLEYSFANDPMSGEVYDKSLQFSPPKTRTSSVITRKAAEDSVTNEQSSSKSQCVQDPESDLPEDEDWSFIKSNDVVGPPNLTIPDLKSEQENAILVKMAKRPIPVGPQTRRRHSTYSNFQPATQSPSFQGIALDDSHDYEPLQPFARPDFPSLVLDRCPVIGVSPQSFLRVCFRVGEMFREGARCHALKQDAVIELFARVAFSSREPGTTKQHFQCADLWHDRPPFPNGMLANYKSSGLTESESRAFIGAKEPLMARCIGRLRRDTKNSTGWLIEIINIRSTDWEEIKWTKRIVSAGLVKSEKGAI